MAETPIVCLCGSTRFRAEIEQANQRFTREGRIVLAPGVFGHSGDPLTEDEKERLDLLHLDKIDLAHQVYVVNPGGYIGESTAREIAYAERTGKPVLYLVSTGRTVLHASGFVNGDRVSTVSLTSYDGDLEDIVPGIVARMESQGHEVSVSRTRPLGDWWLVQVDLSVIVKRDGEEISRMWHVFAYASDQ